MESLLKSLINKNISITYSDGNSEVATVHGTLREVNSEFLKIQTLVNMIYINRRTTSIIDVIEYGNTQYGRS